ncbi:MAG: 2'-5' RNA ligase family protein [Verrucomicrobiota bacterium]|nr:2'-5' RNA ligase family protein [Verrucomicrobiota bacterium]
MAPTKVIAFWLVPAPSAREFFSEVIRELAERHDAPRFEPHLTIGFGALEEARAAEILRNLSIRETITLQIAGLEHSAKYTKTLFVQFHATPQLEALRAELQKATASSYELNPHLSLLYREMPEAARAAAAAAISIPFREVAFEFVQSIITPIPITRPEEVEAWRTLGSRRLDTAPE